MVNNTPVHCLHCNTITNNATEAFCCNGCEKVYNYINSSDLSDHYKYCNEIYNTTPPPVEIKKICFEDFKECIVTREKSNELIMHIPEIFCGACVWLIESAFKKIEILQATVNLTLKTLTVAWDGNLEKIEEFVTLINNLGYNCYPFVEDQVLLQNRNLEHGYLKRIGVSGLSLMFVMVISFCIWVGNADGSMPDYTRAFFHIVNYVVTIPALIYSSKPFFIKTWAGFRNKSMDMNFPIAIAVVMMIIISVQETFLGGKYSYFDSALSLVFALLIGKYLEQKARNKAVYQAYSHISNLPKMVNCIEQGNIVIKLFRMLQVALGHNTRWVATKITDLAEMDLNYCMSYQQKFDILLANVDEVMGHEILHEECSKFSSETLGKYPWVADIIKRRLLLNAFDIINIAEATSVKEIDALEEYFMLRKRLHIDWVLGLALNNEPEEYIDKIAQRALLVRLYKLHAELVEKSINMRKESGRIISEDGFECSTVEMGKHLAYKRFMKHLKAASPCTVISTLSIVLGKLEAFA